MEIAPSIAGGSNPFNSDFKPVWQRLYRLFDDLGLRQGQLAFAGPQNDRLHVLDNTLQMAEMVATKLMLFRGQGTRVLDCLRRESRTDDLV